MNEDDINFEETIRLLNWNRVQQSSFDAIDQAAEILDNRPSPFAQALAQSPSVMWIPEREGDAGQSLTAGAVAELQEIQQRITQRLERTETAQQNQIPPGHVRGSWDIHYSPGSTVEAQTQQTAQTEHAPRVLENGIVIQNSWGSSWGLNRTAMSTQRAVEAVFGPPSAPEEAFSGCIGYHHNGDYWFFKKDGSLGYSLRQYGGTLVTQEEWKNTVLSSPSASLTAVAHAIDPDEEMGVENVLFETQIENRDECADFLVQLAAMIRTKQPEDTERQVEI